MFTVIIRLLMEKICSEALELEGHLAEILPKQLPQVIKEIDVDSQNSDYEL